jgi:hypothetical protein
LSGEMLWELENFGAQIRRATAMFTLVRGARL